jgi:preprotein translocase SecE subunit
MRQFAAWLRSIRQFLISTYHELQRVTWPSRSQTIRLTVIVVVVSLVLGGLLTALDYGLSQGLKLLIN